MFFGKTYLSVKNSSPFFTPSKETFLLVTFRETYLLPSSWRTFCYYIEFFFSVPLIHAVRIYSQDIGMEFGIEKCAMLVMKSGKRHMTDGMELPNLDKIRALGENETYLGILEADTIKQAEIKDKILKEYLRRTWKLLETIPHQRNKHLDVPLVRYSGPFLRWTRDELKKKGTKNKKTNDHA